MNLAQVNTRVADRLQHFRRPSPRGVAWALAAIPTLLMLYVLVLIPFTPSISDIRKAKLEQPAQIISADGKLLTEFKRANRAWVALDEIAPSVTSALIATEDHRFYQHHGLDWRRLGGAALATLSGNRQGGSTLTQQLARNLYPEEIGRSPTLTRKLKEAITALKIEALYTKPEILETYLNTVPFLYNAYGIEMAARTYFNTSASRLDVLQSATLVGMLKGNSYYNPVLNPERALQRRNTVLAQMVIRHQLDAQKSERLKKQPLDIDFERQIEPMGPAPHFAQQVRKWLIEWADRNDYNIYADGLVVHTTLDSRLQRMANEAVARQGRQLQSVADTAWRTRTGWSVSNPLVRAFVRETPEYRRAVDAGLTADAAMKQLLGQSAFMAKLHEEKTSIQAGFMALDPRTSQVRAWVGSRDFQTEPFDHVQQARRQPGSTFKPFVYGAAFENGAKLDDTFIDQALAIPLAGGELWQPGDNTPPTGRPVTLSDALAYSKNTITVQLMQTVGAANVVRLARAMGVRQSPLNPVLSLALGTSPVTLKEMVSAYGTIANQGAYLEPTLVTRIEDSQGKVIAEFQPSAAEPALSPAANDTLLTAMRGVVNHGTGAAIRSRYGIRADVAGKTGTTQDNADGWFILIHPQLVAGAWVGFNDGRITLRSDYWGQGAHSALPIVGDFTAQALRARLIDPRERFTPPPEGWFSRLRHWLKNLLAPATESSRSKTKPRSMQSSAPATQALPASDARAEPPPEKNGPTPDRPDAVLPAPEGASPQAPTDGATETSPG